MAEYKTIGTVVGAGLDALVAVGRVAESAIGKSPTLEEAMAILAGISAVVHTVVTGLEGGATAAQIVAQIDHARAGMEATIASNNAAIDADIDAKFPKGDS